jgi:ribonucleoside-diphosphate reductase alpha chain
MDAVFIDEFQEQIWKDKYQYNNETFEEFCHRISDSIFNTDVEITYRKELFEALINFKVLFGGRINANIGVKEKGLTLFNCFIEPAVSDPDSLNGIMEMAYNYVMTLKTEGGVGFCADFFRPAKTLIRRIGVTTPGAIKFLELFDRLSEIITSGSVDKNDSFQGVPTKNSIRKGATMVTMSICHPDIEEYITAKSIPNKLTKMNMSVLISDAFIEALESNSTWDLWFPDINFEKYETEWLGDFNDWKNKNYPIVIYKTVKATELWDMLLKNSFNRNEPGLIFVDNAKRMDNLWYLPDSVMNCCNPCSEIMSNVGTVEYNGEKLLVGDVCNLGSLNLVRFYNTDTQVFDMDEFSKCIHLLTRALDNISDISGYPLDMYANAAKLKRKIGVGITGIGSLAMMMNMRYGSSEHLEFLEYLGRVFINTAYQSSALLAKEKGPFPLYDQKLIENGFVKNSNVLTDETINLVKKHGLRNAAICACAPNGTLSILAGNVSGGIEPVFAKEFTRWNRVEGKDVSFKYPDIHKGEWFETDYLKEDKVGDEVVLLSSDGNYRVDKNNGLCRKIIIKDYGYSIAEKFNYEETAGAMELSVKEHLEVLAVMARMVDMSVSKTINLPNDISFENFESLYRDIYKYGIKGCTTYREGTSVAVLETSKKKKEKSIKQQQKEFLDAFKDQDNNTSIAVNVKLPEEYPAKGYILKSEGKKWYLHVAFKNKACTKPFALFVNTNNPEADVLTFNALDGLSELSKSVGLNGHLLEEVKKKSAYQKNPVKICRMVGFLLRHNVKVYDIVSTLDGVKEAIPGTFVHRIKKFLSQFVEDHTTGMRCPVCGEPIVFQEGCFVCLQCGYSKCS